MSRAWGVFNKRTGELCWWYDSQDRRQFDIYTRRSDARNAADEWIENDELFVIRKVEVETRSAGKGSAKEERK